MMIDDRGQCINKEYVDKRGILFVTWIGLSVNLSLMIIKFILGIVGKSQALIADAVHTLSDLLTDFAIIFGVPFWSKPADEEHPYGHQRVESIVTIIIGAVLAVAALRIGYEAMVTLRAPDLETPRWIALIGACLSLVIKEILYRWTVLSGRKLRSSAVVANAAHHRSDAISSIPVAFAIAVSTVIPKWTFVDHLGAFVVSIFILISAWNILQPALLELIDTGMKEHMREEIASLILSVPGVLSYHEMRTRKSGPGWYIDIHIQVDPAISVKEGHDIASAVKHLLIQRGRDIIDVLVHVEPYEVR
jgi:cation diffusion facilitator family transporter